MNVEASFKTLYKFLGPNEPSSQIYDNSVQDNVIRCRRKGLYDLFEQLNAFCGTRDIHYFSIADLLVGAIVYEDFLPGEAFAEIGLTRENYIKLEVAVLNECPDKENSDAIGFRLCCQYKGMRILRPYIESSVFTDVTDLEGRPLYDKKHFPYSQPAKIYISIFDELPDDADSCKVFLARTRFLSLIAEAAFARKGGVLGGSPQNESILVKVASRLIPARIAIDHCWKVCGKMNGKKSTYLRRIVYRRSKTFPSADLLPYRMLDFGPVTIEGPQCTSTWIFEDQDLLNSEITILQKDALDIAIEFNRVCKLIGVDYFICGGTMLGYVRHGGFIPWDDDIDFGMLRDDYEHFIAEAPKYLSEEYFLQTRESDPLIPYLFSKIRLNNSEYVTEYNLNRDFHKGICVDLFPFDRVPNDRDSQIAVSKKARALSNKHNRVANHQLPVPTNRVAVNSVWSLIARIFGMLQRHYYWHKSLAETQKKYHDFVRSFNDDLTCEYVASYVPTFTMARISDLLPFRTIQFEGATLLAPAKPEVFLQMQYGDYMEPPMLHQQRGHALLWWSDPVHGRHNGVNQINNE